MKSTVAFVLSAVAMSVSIMSMMRDYDVATAQPAPNEPGADKVMDSVKTRSVAIVNADGAVAMSLTCDDSGQPILTMYDHNGVHQRAVLGLNPDGNSALTLYDKKGNGRIDMFATPVGRAGFELASGDKGAERELAGLFRDENAVPMLLLRDPNGMLRLLQTVSNGAAGMAIYNSQGEPRASNSVDKSGIAKLEILGEGGESVYRVSAEKAALGNKNAPEKKKDE